MVWRGHSASVDVQMVCLYVLYGVSANSEKCVRTPYKVISQTDSRAMHKALARHETVNRRLKQFGVLGKRFRHELRKHVICFNAVTVATQLSFNRGEKPYRVTY